MWLNVSETCAAHLGRVVIWTSKKHTLRVLPVSHSVKWSGPEVKTCRTHVNGICSINAFQPPENPLSSTFIVVGSDSSAVQTLNN